MPAVNRYLPTGFQQMTGLGTAQAPTVPPGSSGCWISVSGQPVRFRDDGIAPTAAIGLRVMNNLNPFLYLGDPGKLQFIEETATAVVNLGFVR
jgi:hypothetical protein